MSKRVLIVDDALIMRKRIGGIAQKAGWDVVGEASHGLEALDLFEQHRPDLVTMDIIMPKLDGVATLRELRGRHPEARVVMVSAVDQRAKLTECVELGAIDFIVKPFAEERLRKLFEKYGADPVRPAGDP